MKNYLGILLIIATLASCGDMTEKEGKQGEAGKSVTGPKGEQGASGHDGGMGPQGKAGTAGSIGPTGTQGATGPQGAQGIQGVAGQNGTNGANGTNGENGETIDTSTWINPITGDQWYLGNFIHASSGLPASQVFCAVGSSSPTSAQYLEAVQAGMWSYFLESVPSLTGLMVGLGNPQPSGGYQASIGYSDGQVLTNGALNTYAICIVNP